MLPNSDSKKKPQVIVHGNKLWEYIKKKAIYNYHMKNITKSEYDQFAQNNSVKDLQDIMKSQIMNYNSIVSTIEGYCKLEEYPFNLKNPPDIFIILLYFLFGMEVANLYLTQIGRKRREYKYNEKLKGIYGILPLSEYANFKFADDRFKINIGNS